MSVYMTEEEQLEVIKKWWKHYGNWVMVIASLILLAFSGYRYMHWHQEKRLGQASLAYGHMMVALSNQNIKSVRSYANELIKDYGNTIYADVAHMTLAKIYISKDKLAEAKHELSPVAQKSKMPALKQIAKIRIARLMASEKSYEDALKELSSIDDDTYLSVINELRGDIYGAKGQYQEAMTAYRKAIDEVKINGMGNLFLEMKTNELAIKSQSVIMDDKKVQTS